MSRILAFRQVVTLPKFLSYVQIRPFWPHLEASIPSIDTATPKQSAKPLIPFHNQDSHHVRARSESGSVRSEVDDGTLQVVRVSLSVARVSARVQSSVEEFNLPSGPEMGANRLSANVLYSMNEVKRTIGVMFVHVSLNSVLASRMTLVKLVNT